MLSLTFYFPLFNLKVIILVPCVVCLNVQYVVELPVLYPKKYGHCNKGVFSDSPVDQIEVGGQVVGLKVAEETRQILLKENLKGCKILQHLPERQRERVKIERERESKEGMKDCFPE